MAEQPMEARIARLESDVAHLRTDVTDIKLDVRSLRDKIDALGVRLDQKIDALGVRFDQKNDALAVRFDQEIDARFDGLRAELASMRVWAVGLYIALAAGVFATMARGFGWI